MTAVVHRTLLAARTGDRERCGLLFGAPSSRHLVVTRVVELANRAVEPDRFALDPGDVVRACRDHETTNLACLGVWHTHPRGGPELSERDRRGAAEGWLSVVVGSASRVAAYRHGADGEVRALPVFVQGHGHAEKHAGGGCPPAPVAENRCPEVRPPGAAR